MFVPIESSSREHITYIRTRELKLGIQSSFINIVLPDPSSLKLRPPFSFINFLKYLLKSSRKKLGHNVRKLISMM